VIGEELTPHISPITLSTAGRRPRRSLPATLLRVSRHKSRTRALAGVASNPLLRHHRRGSPRRSSGWPGCTAASSASGRLGGLCGFGHVEGFPGLAEDVHGASVLGLELGLFSEIKRAMTQAGPRPQLVGQGHRSVSAIAS